ncbi:MAG: hypothetical protein WBG57_02800 [Ornithinimicrobium sp.]
MPSAESSPAPFLRQVALANGLSKHRLDGPAYHQLFGSVRVSAQRQLTPDVLARAALLIVPGAAVSHHSAAQLHRGIVPEDPLTHLTVSTARERRRREGLMVHVGGDRDVVRHEALRVTTPAQTFCDLADHLALVDLVVFGDSLVQRGKVDPTTLREAAGAKATGARARARRAAELVRPGSESPMETRVRLLLLMAGLPEPVINISIGDAERTYRLDLSYPELRFAIEYDGRQHAEDAAQWGHDVGRREWLDDRQWRLLVLRATDVYDTPWATVRKIGAILASRGYHKQLALHPPQTFRQHFPGRPWNVGRSA